MARKVKDAALDSAAARRNLKVRGKPYWRMVDRGLHLGYRRLRGKAGTWWVRHYIEATRSYAIEPLRAAAKDAPPTVADDLGAANGFSVLDFHTAMGAARARQASRGNSSPLTVKDVVEAYLKEREGKGRDVVDSRSRAAAHILPALGDKLVSELTADEIEIWHQGLATSPPRTRTKAGAEPRYRKFTGDKEAKRRRRSSANRVLTILRAAFNHGFRKGKIASDTEWRKVERFKGVDKARLRYLTVAEAQRLVNSCDPDFRPLVRAALQTGARFGQLAHLVVSDFNPDAGTVRLRTRKGDGTEREYHCDLTEEGLNFFKGVCAGRAGSELMFRNTGRIRRATEREQRRREKAGQSLDSIVIDDPGDWRESEQLRPMAEACERVKIKPPIGFHGLRHTWASLAVMNGTPLIVVAKNLGHTDTRMVELHYGHLSPSFTKDAIRAGAPRFGTVDDSNVTAIR